MSKWPTVPLRGHIAEVSERKGGQQVEILSVTNTNGFVRSLEVFDKQVFSEDASSYKVVRAGDLAYNPSRINVGSVARCQFQGGGAVSPMYVVVRCRPTILPDYLLYFLKSEIGLQNIRHRCEGAVRFQLKYSDLERIELAIPPVAEQERIVRLLDEAAALRRLRTQADERTATAAPTIFREMFKKPNDEWPLTTLGCLGTLDRGRSRHRPRDAKELYGGPYPFVQTGDVAQSDGQISAYAQTYSELGLAQSRLWPAGTLCITIAANIAKTGVLLFDACFPDSVVGFLPGPRITTEFAQSLIGSLQAQLEENAPQAAQKNINLGTLRDLSLRLPPLELQRTFSARVTEIRKLEAEQSAIRKRLDDLFQSLLHRAFSGDL